MIRWVHGGRGVKEVVPGREWLQDGPVGGSEEEEECERRDTGQEIIGERKLSRSGGKRV